MLQYCRETQEVLFEWSPEGLGAVLCTDGRHAAQAMLQYCRETREVQLVADRSYKRGEAIKAWCGPQPNRRLLLNYGIVTDDNPYDRLALTVTLPHADALFQAKRAVLQQHKLATQQTFQLQRGKVRAARTRADSDPYEPTVDECAVPAV